MSLEVLHKSKFLIYPPLQKEQSPAGKNAVLGNCGSEGNKNASKSHESVPGEEEPLQTTGILKNYRMESTVVQAPKRANSSVFSHFITHNKM